MTNREQKLMTRLQKRYIKLYGKEANASTLIRHHVRWSLALGTIFLLQVILNFTDFYSYIFGNESDEGVLFFIYYVAVTIGASIHLIQSIMGEMTRSKIEDNLHAENSR